MPKPPDSNFGEPRPRTPAPRIDPVFLWPTPDKEDYIFYVERNGDLPINQQWSYGEAFPDGLKYPNHKLVYVTPQTPDKWSQWFYASNRLLEDEYNWEFTKCDIGGTEYSAIRRTYLIRRSEFSETEPAMASAMPNIPEDKFAEGYVLAARQQTRTQEEQLDSLFVAEVRLYVKRCALTSTTVDELNGKTLYSFYSLYHITETVDGNTVLDLVSAPTNAYWGLQADGTQRTFKAVSCEWYRFETSQVVAGTFASGVVQIASYNSSEKFYWPAVLLDLAAPDGYLEFLDWDRNDGGVDIYPRVVFDKEAYNGPCKALIERSWSKSPQTLSTLNQMLPTPIIYGAPFFNLNVPDCLHGIVKVRCDIGTGDPTYAVNSGSERTVATTNYTDWPASIVAVDDQEPFRGGYLRTKVTIYKPA